MIDESGLLELIRTSLLPSSAGGGAAAAREGGAVATQDRNCRGSGG
jgi:hypothetical protein